jgi:ABC-type xylose transport system permease subunit
MSKKCMIWLKTILIAFSVIQENSDYCLIHCVLGKIQQTTSTAQNWRCGHATWVVNITAVQELRLSQWHGWGFRPSAMPCRVFGLSGLCCFKGAKCLHLQRSRSLPSSQRMKTVLKTVSSFEMLGTTNPVTVSHPRRPRFSPHTTVNTIYEVLQCLQSFSLIKEVWSPPTKD